MGSYVEGGKFWLCACRSSENDVLIIIVDLIFEKGVFERLDKTQVSSYVERLRGYLNEEGVIILYFLMEKGRGTEFTKRLGDLAYVFWNQHEIQQMLEDTDLSIKEIILGEYADYYICKPI